MADVVSPEVRSRMMSGIRGKNTKPELAIRSGLHRRGFRFRLHAKGLPGKPDLVFPRFRAVIFVHGCFWHGHACPLFRLPRTRADFWREKIVRNRSNDDRALAALAAGSWRVAVVWECSLRGKGAPGVEQVCDKISAWLRSETRKIELAR
ncbi:MAG: DNA mismatch endonuclease Vsr [Chitinivibrionia bacterium]|nr:DNA mismatch endonuclease Vsr [Chitinivibrionia bacterium]